jgi:hypothetical protein
MRLHVENEMMAAHKCAVGCGGMEWIELVLDTDKWRALVNAAMKLQVP